MSQTPHIIGGKGAVGLLLFGLLGSLTVLGLASMPAFIPQQSPTTPLRVGIASRPAYARILMAKYSGARSAFVQAGLSVDVQLRDDVSSGTEDFLEGRLDVFWCTIGSLPMLRSRVPTARAIMALAISGNSDGVITTDATVQLAGKPILIVPDSPSYWFLHQYLADIPESEFRTTAHRLIPTPRSSAEALAFLQKRDGGADAAVVWGPEVLLAQQPNRKLTLLASNEKAVDILVAREETLERNSRSLQDFIGALLATPMDNRFKTAELLTRETGYGRLGDPGAVSRLTENFEWADRVANQRMFVTSDAGGPLFDALYADAQNVLIKFEHAPSSDVAKEVRAPDLFFAGLYDAPMPPPPDNACVSMWTDTLHTVYFDTRSYEIDDDQKHALDDWARHVEKYRSASTFCIEGHVDGVPFSENPELGNQRITEVVKYLVGPKHGFDPAQFHKTNYVDTKRADSRSTQNANSRNRRAVVFVSR
jgi:outer membrane protein OmpA-like peptidoglycan-associated protein